MFWQKTPRRPVNMLTTTYLPVNKHHIPLSPTLRWYHQHPNQQTSHSTVTNTTMIPSTTQSTNIASHHHKIYHDTVHTPINKHHIPPSPTEPWYRPHPNQQTSHPTITNTTMIPSTTQSTYITSHRHQLYHTVHTPISLVSHCLTSICSLYHYYLTLILTLFLF